MVVYIQAHHEQPLRSQDKLRIYVKWEQSWGQNNILRATDKIKHHPYGSSAITTIAELSLVPVTTHPQNPSCLQDNHVTPMKPHHQLNNRKNGQEWVWVPSPAAPLDRTWFGGGHQLSQEETSHYSKFNDYDINFYLRYQQHGNTIFLYCSFNCILKRISVSNHTGPITLPRSSEESRSYSS